MDDVEFVEEDSYVYEDSVSSWGLDRIDQDDLPLDDSFSPPGRPMGFGLRLDLRGLGLCLGV